MTSQSERRSGYLGHPSNIYTACERDDSARWLAFVATYPMPIAFAACPEEGCRRG